jgi:filamentous hemagglutinin family protein
VRIRLLISLIFCKFGLFLCGLGPEPALAQAVRLDGRTQTGFSLRPDGQIVVSPAARNAAGVSLNRYTHFDVPKPGVVLDNRASAATTIINEVTSERRTTIEGVLSVEGPRAHVVIANPNGITVNGGRFIGTGNLALTTGRVSLRDGSGDTGR